jgi:hypothetical protein
LGGGDDCKVDATTAPPNVPTAPAFNNVLSDIGTYQGQMPTTPPAAPPANPFFDQKTFDAFAKKANDDIQKLPVRKEKQDDITQLNQLKTREAYITSVIAALAATLTSVQKDFLTYYQNISLAQGTNLPPLLDASKKPVVPYTIYIGDITDPLSVQVHNPPVAYKRIFGRQVVYSINEVNQISVPLASVTATSTKISIATITVLYADPRLEASAGAFFSFVHNRSFANQTVTTPPAGSPLQPGGIDISETKTGPEIVPFVAANWRLFDDFAPAWLSHRRSAVYGTIWVGLNPYTSLPEYGAGPSFSWRSIMLSAVYNRAHEVTLIQGEYAGQPICSPPPPSGSSGSSGTTTLPTCTPAPQAPTTQTIPINAFAIGISIRVPTTFTAGTGGVSH